MYMDEFIPRRIFFNNDLMNSFFKKADKYFDFEIKGFA